MDLYITVRDTNITAAAEKFGLNEYQVIEVEPRA
jgi:hypothetical protein